MTPTKEEQFAAYVNYLTDKLKIYKIFFKDFEAWKKRQYPTLPPPNPQPPTIKTADQILAEHEDANEMHFHQVDREWIVKAMEEYARQTFQNHTCDYVLTSFEGHRVLKCTFCPSIAAI